MTGEKLLGSWKRATYQHGEQFHSLMMPSTRIHGYLLDRRLYRFLCFANRTIIMYNRGLFEDTNMHK